MGGARSSRWGSSRWGFGRRRSGPRTGRGRRALFGRQPEGRADLPGEEPAASLSAPDLGSPPGSARRSAGRPDGPRLPRRQRALPTGRTVAGGFLIAAAAVLVFGTWLTTSRSPGQGWVVAARPLAAGTVLGPGDLTTATMQLSDGTAAGAFRDARRLTGRALAAPLDAGALVQAGALVPSGAQPALRPVSVAVDPVGIDQLRVGQPVDVLVSRGDGSSATISVVVRGAVLIDVGQRSSGLGGTSADATLGVSTLAEVEAVVGAGHQGTVSLVLAEPADGRGPGPGTRR